MHKLLFDQSTREGSAIATLFNRVEAEAERAGGGPWNPGETMDLLLAWFAEQGIDTYGGPIADSTPCGLVATSPDADPRS
jgi:hypothetical protein